ncbi:transcription initiation factor TFIID subunit 10-like isoform X2 [Varroa jacobsoni]|uniref:transcription initiation factor TFIID subunit 10-like isoform X2 n=1 Tax=Varroa jacobsoni TaxID=62625 RepID=UPI000BF977B7|nr:transcription initiation factor TFIID subunit 10-like isoform X2 [Varroa jacobsoni]
MYKMDPSSHGEKAHSGGAASGGSTSQQQPEFKPSPPLQLSMQELLAQLDEYQPTIPDAVTSYYMNTAGVETSDPKVIRLISLAAQKFVADITNDALQHCKMRGAGQSSKKALKDKKYVLTTEDLTSALSEYGIQVKKPAYYN